MAAPGCAVSCAVSSPCDSGTGLPCRGSSLFKTEGWKFGILGSWPSLTLKTTPQAQRISHCCSTTGGGFSRKGGQMAFSGPSSEMWSVMHGVNEAWCPLNTACPGRAGVRPSPASFWASWPCALKHTHTHTALTYSVIHELPGPLHTPDDSWGCSHAQAHTQCDAPEPTAMGTPPLKPQLCIARASANDLRSWLFRTACSLSFCSLFHPLLPILPSLAGFSLLLRCFSSSFWDWTPPSPGPSPSPRLFE